MATHEMERPLASFGVYVEELLRLASRAETHEGALLLIEEMRPLLDKLGERALDMEVVLQNARRLRDEERSFPVEPPPVAPTRYD